MFVILSAILPLSVFADGVKVGDLYYILSGVEAHVTSYDVSAWHGLKYNADSYTIPSIVTYNGLSYTVTQIGDQVFGFTRAGYSSAASKIILPETLKKIGDSSFGYCTNLVSMVIPASVETMSFSSFTGCNLLRTMIYLGKTPPYYWTVTSNTYVPDLVAYANANPRININNASIKDVKEMITFDTDVFDYTGTAPNPTWTNNVEGYTATLSIPELNGDVGSHEEWIPVTFTKGDESFTANVVYRYTIKPVELRAKVSDVSREYGEDNPQFNISYSGFVAGENENTITVRPTVSTSAIKTSNVGEYPITISGGVAQNYTLKYETGTLTITKAALEVSVNDATKVYGSENPAFTLNYYGLKNNETKPSWDKSPTFSTAADKTSDVGDYQITVDCSATNYNITKNNFGTLSVTPAALTVKANNASRLYFDADPEYTYVATGFLNGDTDVSFTQGPKFKTDATATSNVGTYTITPYGAESKNYNITYETGNLAITKRDLTATVDAISREYGENNPIFKISYNGFVNNENESTLDVIPSATTPATPTSNVGTYTVSLNGGSATNYNITLKSGILTITKAPLAIVINDATRSYGAPNPSFEAIYSGLKNDEIIPAWSTSPSFKTNATITSAVGSYPIEMTSGTLRNYEISGVTNGTLSITPAQLTIKAKDANKTYYEENPSFTYVCTGFVNGDNATTALQVQPTLSTIANQSSIVGTYEIIAKDASSNNYNIVYDSGVLTVNKRQLTAKVGNYERVYGEENPIFAVEYEGFAGSDSESSLSVKPTAKTSAISISNVGTYPINVYGGDALNYKFSYTSGTLKINKAEQTLEWNQDLSNVQVGSQVELTAVASSGLPVEYALESNNSASLYKVGSKTYIDCIAAGQLLLRASQSGDNNYYGTPRATNAINIVGNTIADPTLTIIQGEKGLIRTQVTKGSVYTFSIEATDGWKVHSVSFNDEDITDQLDANNRFTTPNINASTTLNVVYESSNDDINSAKVSSAKILGTSYGIKVENAKPNEVLKVYTVDGKLVKSQKLQSSEVDVDLPNNETYIINLEDLRVKVRL